MNNLVNLIGNAGGDPVLTTFESGSQVAKFSIAVKQFGADGEQKPMWVEIEAWGNTAKRIMDTISKGREVAVTGRLDVSTWDRKVGSQTVQMSKVVVKLVGFHACGRKLESTVQQPQDVKLEAAETKTTSKRSSKKDVA